MSAARSPHSTARGARAHATIEAAAVRTGLDELTALECAGLVPPELAGKPDGEMTCCEKRKEEKMKQAAQGDLLVTRIDHIPATARAVAPTKGRHIVAHSETGHHHWVGATGTEYLADPSDPLRAYLRCEATATLLHDRPWDTHAPIALTPGCYELRRQREYIPEGWRRVED